MTVDEKQKDDATWASDRLYDTYSRHCKNMGEEPELSYEEFKENIRRSDI